MGECFVYALRIVLHSPNDLAFKSVLDTNIVALFKLKEFSVNKLYLAQKMLWEKEEMQLVTKIFQKHSSSGFFKVLFLW